MLRATLLCLFWSVSDNTLPTWNQFRPYVSSTGWGVVKSAYKRHRSKGMPTWPSRVGSLWLKEASTQSPKRWHLLPPPLSIQQAKTPSRGPLQAVVSKLHERACVCTIILIHYSSFNLVTPPQSNPPKNIQANSRLTLETQKVSFLLLLVPNSIRMPVVIRRKRKRKIICFLYINTRTHHRDA